MSIEVYKGEMESMMADGATLVDVRETDELQTDGTIPGYVHLPLSRFAELANTIKLDRPVIFYCRSGMRAFQAAQVAGRLLTQPVYYLSGGLLGYLDS